jgi:hypothetical protein
MLFGFGSVLQTSAGFAYRVGERKAEGSNPRVAEGSNPRKAEGSNPRKAETGCSFSLQKEPPTLAPPKREEAEQKPLIAAAIAAAMRYTK